MADSIRCRRSRALIFRLEGKKCTIHAFLSNTQISCDAKLIPAIQELDEWISISEILERTTLHSNDLTRLIEASVLLVEGTEEEISESRYSDVWEWGDTTGFYHFCARNTPYLPASDEKEWIKERASERTSPPLLFGHEASDANVELSSFETKNTLRKAMFNRRTERRQNPDFYLPLEQLTDILFSGLGVTAFYDFPDYGRLPLKMSPSGGGRNPYEGYVLVDRVIGLEAGVYHYSAVQHSLCRVGGKVDRSYLFADQEWVSSTAATIVFVANFERDWWKYPFPASYRPVLIEIGHVVQNMMLLATEQKLSCVPTAAIRDSYAEEALGLDFIKQALFYSVSIGEALPEHKDWK